MQLLVLDVGAVGTTGTPRPTRRPPPPRRPRPAYPRATPYDGVTYQDHGVNPFVDPREDRVSTFALDVDTASYAIAQRYVEDGNRPDPASVRVEEWVNAFDQGYRAPGDDAFAISVDGGPTPFTGPDEVLVRIGLQAREVRERQRQDASLTFVIDTSGSMEREGRLELVKDALRILVDELGPDDRVAVVTFGNDARLVLESTPADDRRAILRAIDRLQPDGSTNLEAGLRLGYEQARRSMTENGIDRVVVASDGVANVGLTDADGILRGIRDDAANGIELVSVGVGMGNYNDALLEQLADQGDGFYAYVNGIDDAKTLFRDRLTSTLQTVALDAKAQVEFDPRAVDGLSPRRLRGPRRPGRVLHRSAGGRRRHRGRPRGDGALRRPAGARTDRGRDPFATIRLRWTDPDSGDTQRAVAGHPLGATSPARSTGPIRTSGWTPSWRPRRRSCATARTRTASASRTSSTWPIASGTCRAPTRSTGSSTSSRRCAASTTKSPEEVPARSRLVRGRAGVRVQAGSPSRGSSRGASGWIGTATPATGGSEQPGAGRWVADQAVEEAAHGRRHPVRRTRRRSPASRNARSRRHAGRRPARAPPRRPRPGSAPRRRRPSRRPR